MKRNCLHCIDGRLTSGRVCGRCNGAEYIEKPSKARLEIDLAKFITWEEGHGFVLQDMNDSIYFPSSEAIKIADFISQHHGLDNSVVMVKSKLLDNPELRTLKE